MGGYTHWFVSRQKRSLTTVLYALIAFSDICEGKRWEPELQLLFEEELAVRDITEHGSLRSRRVGQGGGGVRTLFKQMKDLGLVFLEEDTRICRLTLVSEQIITGKLTFVEAMRMQLQRYQYPSASSCKGSGSVSSIFKVHPFSFIFRLLLDERLGNVLTVEEFAAYVIHFADSDEDLCLNEVVNHILRFRHNDLSFYVSDTESRTYYNIANTFFNYISLTQYVDRGYCTLSLRSDCYEQIKQFIQLSLKSVLLHPEISENYQRSYGRGLSSKDLRSFSAEKSLTQREIFEQRVMSEYLRITLKKPVTSITSDIVEEIVQQTGFSYKLVSDYLLAHWNAKSVDDFFVGYRELANMGRAGAKSFELATCEVFRRIFGMRAVHIGNKGNTPDVFVESSESHYCGIIDNKAYHNGYSISGDHRRVMEDVYIPDYSKYIDTAEPLQFFSYISGSFGKNINSQIMQIHNDTHVKGSAVPVDVFIDFAQNYKNNGYTHDNLLRLFSLNREVTLSDL